MYRASLRQRLHLQGPPRSQFAIKRLDVQKRYIPLLLRCTSLQPTLLCGNSQESVRNPLQYHVELRTP